MLKTISFTLAASFAASAAAQGSARPDPADPKAPAPSQPYESAFKDYRPYADPGIARWRESNEEAGRLGGHRGHMPKSPAAAEKAVPKEPAKVGHGGHK